MRERAGGSLKGKDEDLSLLHRVGGDNKNLGRGGGILDLRLSSTADSQVKLYAGL